MSADIVIKTNKLSCLSGSQFLLNSISWQVEKGDQWVVFGRNGCGKTTLLSIIAGYKSYTSGELEVFGQKYDANNILAIRKKIGCPDLLILFTGTASHKMAISASQEAKKNNIPIAHVHTSSAAALHSVLAEHCSC